MKLVADIDIPFLKGVFEPYFSEVVYLKGDQISNSDLQHATALIVRTRTNCNEALLKNSDISVIASATIGVDHIDLEYCTKKGIKVFHAPGCNSGAVLQWVLSAIFSVYIENDTQVNQKVLGIVGVGNIGSKLENAAKALGFQVLLCDPLRQRAEGGSNFTNLISIAKESDILSFHVPLTFDGNDATYHLANEFFFGKLKPNSFILNSSRGGVIDEKCLINSLFNNRVFAALDVWENEPNPSEELIRLASISTPHIAGYSLEGKINATKAVVKSISEHFNLNLGYWKPNPDPCEQKIRVEYHKLFDRKDSIYKLLFNHTYSVEKDSNLLKSNVGDFEKFRDTYSFRRENSGHVLSVRDGFSPLVDWNSVGFSLV